jgi:hypothetical protein
MSIHIGLIWGLLSAALAATVVAGCERDPEGRQPNIMPATSSTTESSPAAHPKATPARTTAKRTVLLRDAVKQQLGADRLTLRRSWVTPDGGIVTSWSNTVPDRFGEDCNWKLRYAASAFAGQRGAEPVWVIPIKGVRQAEVAGESIWARPAYDPCVRDAPARLVDPDAWLLNSAGRVRIVRSVTYPLALTAGVVVVECQDPPCLLDPRSATYGSADIDVPKGFQLLVASPDLAVATKFNRVALSEDGGHTWRKHSGYGPLIAPHSGIALVNSADRLDVTTDGGATWKTHETRVMDEGTWVVTRSGRVFFTGFSYETEEVVCGRSVHRSWTQFEPVAAPHGCGGLASAGDLIYVTTFTHGAQVLSISRDFGDTWEQVTLR